jgi:uncharacterized surface anchored protein
MIAGKVRSASGAPVEGANLQLTDGAGRRVFFVSRTQSSSDGTYEQAGLKPGTYTASFEKEGYAPASQSIEITREGVAQVDFVLLQGGRLRIVVGDAAGAAVEGADVALLGNDGKAVTKGLTLTNLFSAGSDRTDVNGTIVLRGVAPGTYTVLASRSGVSARSRPFEVLEGAETPVELTLGGSE